MTVVEFRVGAVRERIYNTIMQLPVRAYKAGLEREVCYSYFFGFGERFIEW